MALRNVVVTKHTHGHLDEGTVEQVAHAPLPQRRQQNVAQPLDVAAGVGRTREEVLHVEIKLLQYLGKVQL